MRFLVISAAPTLFQTERHVAYAPYVREMDIWSNYIDDFIIVSPTNYKMDLLTLDFKKQPKVISIPSLDFTSMTKALKSMCFIPLIVFKIVREMNKANHIHLRCPGNIGLLACLVQVFFPKKIKTAKYAGNWDPKSKQPLSYRLQKRILSNTFLTKNMSVLVYGKWKNQTKNIIPFFTATFSKDEVEPDINRNYSKTLNFIFVGSLVEGKRPLLVIKIIEQLIKSEQNVVLDLYGDGELKPQLKAYVNKKKLHNIVKIHGNQPKEVIKTALKTSHFLLLPSKSEGWPKAVAEAMFFGSIPISTNISCVSNMLGNESRGILIKPNMEEAVLKIKSVISNKDLKKMSKLASQWSQKFTLEYFESEIKKKVKQ